MANENPQHTVDPIISAAAEEAKTRKTFFSFGDEGLTASVSSYGRLLRITQHFPKHKTGFCVDPRGMPEPYYTTKRMDWFLFLAQYRDRYGLFQGIGPCLDSLCMHAEAPPQHEIINDRWPTFSQSSESFKLHVGYVASAGTIYQKFEFFPIDGQNNEKEPWEDAVFADLSLRPDLLIRDLDFVNKNNEFNAASASEIEPGNPPAYTTQLSDTHKRITRTHKLGEKDILLHIHVLSNDGSIQLFKRDKSTAVDKHGNSPGPSRESSYHIGRSTRNDRSILESHDEGPVIRFVLAYTLDQVSKPRRSLPTWETFCNADSLLQPRKDEEPYLCQDPTLNFFFKRNLEYILSVCSVPIPQRIKHDDAAIALTCGDVEGHRVATPASL